MSNVTSICGTPRDAGGMSGQVETAQRLVVAAALHFALTLDNVHGNRGLIILGSGKESALALVGIVVFFSISLVITPPRVSIPSDNGVTSSNNTSLTSPPSTPP